ncbi:hypothetical protein PGTUg99_025474 [Puccinia graminis f. sp. tritici]|uniref:Uncharacterized protein n=1 Tax=Puccinia graminis f. sp. tritici TaxID=56615 RepID=A0A5B0SJB6_PUCGR|nr:hypothetical protein PGTUg99_025474 [Puccinia graminis f. sp. tritici]
MNPSNKTDKAQLCKALLKYRRDLQDRDFVQTLRDEVTLDLHVNTQAKMQTAQQMVQKNPAQVVHPRVWVVRMIPEPVPIKNLGTPGGPQSAAQSTGPSSPAPQAPAADDEPANLGAPLAPAADDEPDNLGTPGGPHSAAPSTRPSSPAPQAPAADDETDSDWVQLDDDLASDWVSLDLT